MASEKDLELLDQYVSNRLTDQDRTAFEQKLSSDTSLRNEYKLQQKLVEKIREARVKELKAMFNNIPASSLETGGTSIVGQVALWVAVVGSIGAGIYFYLHQEDKDQPIVKQEEVTPEAPQTVEPQQEAPKQENPVATEEGEPEEMVTSPTENKKKDVELPQAQNEGRTKEEPKGPAPLDVFDPSEETETSRTPNADQKITDSTPLNKSSIVVEIDNSNKKFDFHYQFKNSKLYLYGNFEKNLYEIMEFFSGNKRTVFLFYKDSYYLLSEENDTIKSLAPINDPALLQKLKDYRGTR